MIADRQIGAILDNFSLRIIIRWMNPAERTDRGRAETARRSPISAIIFDCDGLLADTERPWLQAYQEACLPYGVMLEDFHWRDLMGQGKLTAAVIKLFSLPAGEEENLRQQARAAFGRITAGGISPMPGAVELVTMLRPRYPLAIASGSHTQQLMTMLNHWNLRDAFAVVIGGEQVTRGKPAPDIFLKAADQLRINPSACLVFEDSAMGYKRRKQP